MNKYEIRRLNLKHLCDTKFGSKVASLARSIDKDASYVSRLLYPEGKNGKKRIGDELVESIQNAFSLPPGWLDIPHWNGEKNIIKFEKRSEQNYINEQTNYYRKLYKVPLIDWSEAAQWNELKSTHEPAKWLETNTKMTDNAFALKVVGDSMVNPYGSPSIPNNYMVIAEPDIKPKNGHIVIARINNSEEAIIKQYVTDGNKKYLKALNPSYPAIEIDENCIICGVVVRIQYDLIP